MTRAKSKQKLPKDYYPPGVKDVGSDLGLSLSKLVVGIATLPAKFYVWLTGPVGVAVVSGIAILYFAAVNAEGYYELMPGDFRPFVFKPGVDDEASVFNILWAFGSGAFWTAALLSSFIQGIQALVIRESLTRTKAEYDRVAKHKVPEGENSQIDLAQYRRMKYKRAGMKKVRMLGLLIFLSYGIDTTIAVFNNPFWGVEGVQLVINIAWAVISVIATECAINIFMTALEGDG